MAAETKSSRPDRGAAPRVTARRTTKYASRVASSSRSFNVERPPIIIEIGSSVVRVGFAEQFKPQHILPYIPADSTGREVTRSESQWYAILSPLIDQTYDRLMVNPTTRRVVCVHSHYPEKAWEAALKQIFWNRGVPALSLVSSLEMIPVAQGWKRGIIVQVGMGEAVCVAHVDGHILPFTYQSVPRGYNSVMSSSSSSGNTDEIQCTWNASMDRLWVDERDPNSLVVALIKCLEACPRDSRMYAVSNLVFSGEALMLVPDLPRRVAKRLKFLLEGGTEALLSDPTTTSDEASEEKEQKEDDERQLTSLPIQTASLKSLADRLAVTSCSPYRPDLISWVGTSLWAAVWYKYDDDETRINWTFAPSE
jgi:hypothetical protein